MGRRAFRRSVSDASLGRFTLLLGYKAERSGTRIVRADRFFASSQIHHGWGCRLVAPTRLAKHLACSVTGEVVDRDINAAKNLRDWPESATSPGPLGAGAPVLLLRRTCVIREIVRAEEPQRRSVSRHAAIIMV